MLRVAAMAGVVLGHWLVTALVSRASGLHVDSPLRHLPYLWPATWPLQTLGPFFFAGGFGAAASHGRARRDGVGYRRWLVVRLARLGYAVGLLGAFWLVVLATLAAAGVSGDVLTVAATLAVSPLWFLAVYVGLVALTPPLLAAVRRLGAAAVLVPLPVVGPDDLVRFGPDQAAAFCPAWLTATLRALAVPCAWLVPFLLGLRWHGRTPRRAVGVAMLGGGLAAAAVLVGLGYPASAVGVTGAAESNLSPPTLFTVSLATAQLGAFLLARPHLARLAAAPRLAPVLPNATALTLPVFLWHQTALLLVLLVAGGPSAAPGLLGTPDAGWLAARLVWLPAFAAVLAALCRLSRGVRGRRLR
ncbi:MAG: acyltransferase [Streptosporangiales bacterium]|nr:acyltransferase [Streptosporangiales bacterium]MBO0889876.1 hypothetical protein [Acidothermales bacterium]